ncbi:stage V sporulation protein SpoVM [Ureibacillus composti]|uniref:Stage V sporulation protein SpoVM n=1 Tax=Lysinibacillus composti TaxID=720633 RepID=A0A3N9UFZ5_9BACI|nr:stage V sporulation protein SpoVM [Lysinibacillus composti]MDM5332681.1 stage V sporulation protein SpoVM [Ureibacillus composti]RQW75005.1 stage V sporulation protein SpoVM [Lysinibacillus composti]
MRVYTFQLPKFVSSFTRSCIKLFKGNKKKKGSD